MQLNSRVYVLHVLGSVFSSKIRTGKQVENREIFVCIFSHKYGQIFDKKHPKGILFSFGSCLVNYNEAFV